MKTFSRQCFNVYEKAYRKAQKEAFDFNNTFDMFHELLYQLLKLK